MTTPTFDTKANSFMAIAFGTAAFVLRMEPESPFRLHPDGLQSTIAGARLNG